MRLRPSLVAIITCLGVAACGGSSHNSTTASSSTAPAPAPVRTSTSASAGTASVSDSFTVTLTKTTTTTHASAPPEVTQTKTHAHPGESGGKGGVAQDGQSGVSQGAHVEADVSIAAGGNISPPVVSVPSGVEVEIKVTNHGASAVTVSVAGTPHASARLNAGSSAKLRTEELRSGTYRILVNGTPRGQILAGAQGGP